MNILKIIWQDSGSFDTQWASKDEIEYPKAQQVSIGFLVKENKRWIVLANTYDKEHDNYAGITKILKKCIITKNLL